jgi:nitrogen regulatory protein PII
MIEAYTTEEAVNSYTKYIQDGRAIGLPVHQHEGRTSGMGCTGWKVCTNVENEMVRQAHYRILHQLVVMETYVEKHLDKIYAAHDGQRTEAWVYVSSVSNVSSRYCMCVNLDVAKVE